MSARTAQLARRKRPGERAVWALYVCIIPGSASDWPEYVWPKRRTAVPTLAERRRVLAGMGYVPLDNGPWQWTEDEDTGSVMLIASTDVRSLDGGAS